MKKTQKRGERKPMKKPLKIGLIVGVVLLVIVGAVFAFLKSKLNKIDYDDGKLHFASHQEEQEYLRELERRIINGEDDEVKVENDNMEEAAKNLEPVEVRPATPSIDIRHDDNILNILLIGTDERTQGFSTFARADSIMILSLNKATGAAKLVSLERGMGVPILDGAYKGQWDWITHTFCYGGADLLMKEVRECFRIDVNRYIRVNFTTFQQGIEAMGGVDINLTQAEADYLNSLSDKLSLDAGPHRLRGWVALQYARCRKIDSDWQRIKRQRTVIQAALNKTKSLSVGELNNLLNQVLPLVRTNLTQGEIASLMALAPRFQGVTMSQMTIPIGGTYGSMRGMGGRVLFAVDFTANAKALQNFLYS